MLDELSELREQAVEAGLPAVPETLDAVEALYTGQLGWWQEAFEALSRAQDAVEHLEREAVRLARLDGESWQSIAGFLGLSRQGAQKRYASTGLEELDALDELHEAETKAFQSDLQVALAQTKRRLQQLPAKERTQSAWTAVMTEQGYAERLASLLNEHSATRRALVHRLAQGKESN